MATAMATISKFERVGGKVERRIASAMNGGNE